MLELLRFIRWALGVAIAAQVYFATMLTIALLKPTAIGSAFALFGVSLLALSGTCYVFFWLRGPINRMHTKKHGESDSSFAADDHRGAPIFGSGIRRHMKGHLPSALIFTCCFFAFYSLVQHAPNFVRGAYFGHALRPGFLLIIASTLSLGAFSGALLAFQLLIPSSYRHHIGHLCAIGFIYTCLLIIIRAFLPIGSIAQLISVAAVLACITIPVTGRVFRVRA